MRTIPEEVLIEFVEDGDCLNKQLDELDPACGNCPWCRAVEWVKMEDLYEKPRNLAFTLVEAKT